jgi:hypothetical protein
MRPCFYEMMKGLIHTWENEIFPIVSDSGQGEMVRRMRGGSTVLRLMAASYDSEGEKLFEGNRMLRKELRASVPHLEKAGLTDLTDMVEAMLEREYFPPDRYPALKMLVKEANDLNTLLEKVLAGINTLSTMENHLEPIRDRLLNIMRQQVEQDMDLEMIIRGDYSHLEDKMDDFIRFAYSGALRKG